MQTVLSYYNKQQQHNQLKITT